MQDDDAFDNGVRQAIRNGEPFYVDHGGCLHDETGRYPDVPDGCFEFWRRGITKADPSTEKDG